MWTPICLQCVVKRGGDPASYDWSTSSSAACTYCGQETYCVHEEPPTKEPFEFDRGEFPDNFTLSNAVFQALGAASVCWSETPHGVFDSDRAQAIGKALLREIVKQVRREQKPLWDAAQTVATRSRTLDEYLSDVYLESLR